MSTAVHGWAWRYRDDPIFDLTASVVDALRERGVGAEVYQDGTSGGLLCLRIPLDPDDLSEHGTSLYVSTENAEHPDWCGQVVTADGECSDLLAAGTSTDPAVVAEAVARLVAEVVQ